MAMDAAPGGQMASRASHPAVRFLPMRAHALLPAIGLVLAAALTGCAQSAPIATPQASSTPSASPTPTPEAAPTVFRQPALCAEALPAELIADLEVDRGLVLLGGPEGRYGLDYSLDPTPEERAGGITCIWGFGDTEMSSVTVSVAPITAESRAPIVAQLVYQGLNESVAGDANVYWQEGDTEEQPAIVNVVRPESWISVIQTIGGRAAYDEAVEIANDAHETVYR
jgi:hypothetical protein